MSATSLTIAERRVDELQSALTAAVQASERLKGIVREELRILDEALEQAAEAIYNATLYDPEGVRDDAS